MDNMDASHSIVVPLRAGGGGGGKKMKKRRELDALIAKANRGRYMGGSAHSQDKLMSASTDDQDDYNWAKVNSNSHNRMGCSRRLRLRRIIIPLLIGTACLLVGFVVSWLYFDMKQQFDDYRQKIEEVSAANKGLPNTLQDLHETSTNMMRNQTALLLKLDELQRNVDTLRMNFTDYRASIDAQQNYVKYNKLVADFGAKIEATTMDIERMKEHYNNFIVEQKQFQDTLQTMQNNFTQLKNQTLGGTQIPYNNVTDELHSIRDAINAEMKALEANLSLYNSSFNQQSDMMRVELAQHKTELDKILDRLENITSHVSSIEKIWPEMRQKLQDGREQTNRLDGELTKLKLLLQTAYADVLKEKRQNIAGNLGSTRPEQLWNGPTTKEDTIADMINATAAADSDNNNNGKSYQAPVEIPSALTTTTTTTSPASTTT